MINLLRRIFIKDYKNINDAKVRTAHGKLASLFGVITNVILFAVKLVFGIIASSISIIADSINNLSDTGNSFVALIGFKISSKPADKEHPFGHQRLEYLAGLIISIVIVVLAGNMLVQSIQRIISNETSVYTLWTFIILGVAILLKIYQSFFNYRVGKLISSITLKATAVDSLMDVFATSAVLASALVSYYLGWNIDGYMGILVSIIVGYSGIKMIKETIDPLIGKAADKDLVKKVIKEIMTYDGVLGVHDVRAHSYGPTKIYMSLHVEVNCDVDVVLSHELIDKIETDIKEKYNIDLVIHMDPIDPHNEETILMLDKVQNALLSISKNLSMHDFRIIKEKNHNKAIFEIVVPFDCKLSHNEILRQLNTILEIDNLHISLEPTFETPFVEQ
ncbi:MAG: cation diffusion facilitator family transporter [Bacilli bacterium]|nr:cation diffusion facilitator family transporter [Bacilli bacterium]